MTSVAETGAVQPMPALEVNPFVPETERDGMRQEAADILAAAPYGQQLPADRIEHVDAESGVAVVSYAQDAESSRRSFEVRRDPEVRIALIVHDQDGAAYTITQPSPAVYDAGPVTLDMSNHDRAVELVNGQGGMGLGVTDKYSGSRLLGNRETWRSLYTSAEDSTNYVGMRTREIGEHRRFVSPITGAVRPLSTDTIETLRANLQKAGLELQSVEDVAIQTADMATFAQMVEQLTPQQLTQVLEARQRVLAERQLFIEKEVTHGFLCYTSYQTVNLTHGQYRAVRGADAMRKLHGLLREDYGSVDVEWAGFDADGELAAASVNAFSTADDQETKHAVLVQPDTVVTATTRGRRTLEISRQTGSAAQAVGEAAVSGLFVSANSTREVSVVLGAGKRLFGSARRAAQAADGTEQHSVRKLLSGASDLTSYLAALLARRQTR